MKKIITALLVVVLILGVAVGVSASNGSVDKTITYRDIKITLNDRELIPTDSNGNPTEPFIMDGSTYLPVRAVAGALGRIHWLSTEQPMYSAQRSWVRPAARLAFQ